ncbi:MAG: SDR family NAD(P)-dependent oxidoreductase, partial [Candidatus Eisenbacteria bacterium]|nr:SDR family NAD(P)-dependent oxidoreductase [Candidatus Eisenbacteria bacterium]
MSEPSTILITGASTGIGRHLAETLSQRGERVFASARKPGDLDDLARLPGVTALPLDVRDPASVTAARRQVAEAGLGLDAGDNNAGVGGIGPFASWTERELHDLFEVNVFGPVRVIQAFLPMLLARRGRIVNIGSQGGSTTSSYFGPYTMTKHALEALTVSLRDELGPHGIEVSIVQPGGIVSAIGASSQDADLARFRRAPAPFAEEAL